jgi:hypothetical protein
VDLEQSTTIAYAHGLAQSLVTHPVPLEDDGVRLVAQRIVDELQKVVPGVNASITGEEFEATFGWSPFVKNDDAD